VVGLSQSCRACLKNGEDDAPFANVRLIQGVLERSATHDSRPRGLPIVEDRIADGLRLLCSPDVMATVASRSRYRASKRVLDILFALIGLVLSAPFFAVFAILIRLDSSGPVFFRQVRVGLGGRLFTILKLRTMHEAMPEDAQIDASRSESERVTRVGHHLRRWSLDELPQFINVLRGDMSLVGPRPELPEIVFSSYQPWQFARFRVPQGMTGWWQVTERGRIRLCEDTADDLVYIERASFWFDLRILLLTIPAVSRQARSG